MRGLKGCYEKTSHIIKMIDMWNNAMYGTNLTKAEKKHFKKLIKKYPEIKMIYEAGDFSGCAINDDGQHVWDWTEKDWRA